MILGNPAHFTRAHFEAQKGVAPAHLCELVVHCLELVAQLAQQGLAYRFKGGNSLLVLLEDPRRFSIDVDIVCAVEKAELIDRVERIVDGCERFRRCEIRPHKTKPWLPMISFKLFFDSVYQDAQDAYVMLDAVLEPAPYPGVRRPVRCGALYEAPVVVEVPSISGLMGDKLLCLGPATLGIPLGKGKDAQRLKHVFDVATLARQPHDRQAVCAAVIACMAQENRIQRSAWSLEEVVADTRRFCQAPLEHTEPPDAVDPGSYLGEIVSGLEGFRGHLFREAYDWAALQDDLRQILRLLEILQPSAQGVSE